MLTKLSYANNCLVYSAILRNGTESDIVLLQKLRAVTDLSKVTDYYNRSANIIKLITGDPNYDETYWDSHYEQYIIGVIESLKANNSDEAIDKILEMIDSLETELGIQ
jgi:hypothetical protein